jgi:hypothetical protein
LSENPNQRSYHYQQEEIKEARRRFEECKRRVRASIQEERSEMMVRKTNNDRE